MNRNFNRFPKNYARSNFHAISRNSPRNKSRNFWKFTHNRNNNNNKGNNNNNDSNGGYFNNNNEKYQHGYYNKSHNDWNNDWFHQNQRVGWNGSDCNNAIQYQNEHNSNPNIGMDGMDASVQVMYNQDGSRTVLVPDVQMGQQRILNIDSSYSHDEMLQIISDHNKMVSGSSSSNLSDCNTNSNGKQSNRLRFFTKHYPDSHPDFPIPNYVSMKRDKIAPISSAANKYRQQRQTTQKAHLFNINGENRNRNKNKDKNKIKDKNGNKVSINKKRDNNQVDINSHYDYDKFDTYNEFYDENWNDCDQGQKGGNIAEIKEFKQGEISTSDSQWDGFFDTWFSEVSNSTDKDENENKSKNTSKNINKNNNKNINTNENENENDLFPSMHINDDDELNDRFEIRISCGNVSYYGMDLLTNHNEAVVQKLLSDLMYRWSATDSLVNCKPNQQVCNQFKLQPDFYGNKTIWFIQGKRLYLLHKVNEYFMSVAKVVEKLMKRIDQLYFLITFQVAGRIPYYLTCIWKNKDMYNKPIHNSPKAWKRFQQKFKQPRNIMVHVIQSLKVRIKYLIQILDQHYHKYMKFPDYDCLFDWKLMEFNDILFKKRLAHRTQLAKMMFVELPKSMAPKIYQATEEYVVLNRNTLLKSHVNGHANNPKSYKLLAKDWKQIMNKENMKDMFDWIFIDQELIHCKVDMIHNVSADIGSNLFNLLQQSHRGHHFDSAIKIGNLLNKSVFIQHWNRLDPLVHPKQLEENMMLQFINNTVSVYGNSYPV